MNYKVRTLVGLFFFIALIFFSVDSFSQPGGGGGGRPCPRPPCPQTPITGIEILIGGGAVLGIRKLLKGKKSNLK